MLDMPNEAQQIVLSITPIVTGLLSIFGSMGIMTIVLKEGSRHRRTSGGVYRRLLFCISFFDTLSSLNHCSSSFAMPKGTPGVWHPIGNDVTCTIQGFLAQLNFAAELYVVMLAIYYFAEIQARVVHQDRARKYEPLMHFVAVLPPTTFAILGLVLGVYGTLPLGVIVACMVGIYWKVRKQLMLMENRYGALSQQNRSAARRLKLRRTAWQAFFYVIAWFNTYLWVGVARAIEDLGATDGFFWVRMMSAIFFPLQGFFNFVIFVRPRWYDLRQKYPREPSVSLIRRILSAKQGTYTRNSRQSQRGSFHGGFLSPSSSNFFVRSRNSQISCASNNFNLARSDEALSVEDTFVKVEVDPLEEQTIGHQIPIADRFGEELAEQEYEEEADETMSNTDTRTEFDHSKSKGVEEGTESTRTNRGS